MAISQLAPRDVAAVIIRRKWFITGCILVSLILAGVAATFVPPRFKSVTTLAVENQKIPENYVKDVLTGNVQDRLGTIQQVLLSRSLLTEVMKKHRLYNVGSGELNTEAIVSRVRQSISVSPAKDQVFSIAFTYYDPFIAQQVAADLGRSFIEENSKIRAQMVEGANEFLSTELDKARAELERKENAVGEFKRVNMGELPQQLEANLRALDRQQLQAVALNDTLDNRLGRLAQLEKAIQEYEPGVTASVEPSMPSDATNETMTPARRRIVKSSDPRDRIKELKQNLTKLLAVYKGSYPDAIALKDEISSLEAQVSTGNEEFAQNDEPANAVERVEMKSGKKPKVDMYLNELLRHRSEIKAEIDGLKDRIGKAAIQIKEYEKRVEQVPRLEQELQILTRDYENMQRNYQSLLNKRLDAKISENLEHRQKGEHFRIIDTANLPLSPEPPTPLHIVLAGLLVGCGVGIGGAMVGEQLAGVFRKPEEAERLLGFHVLATIPNIHLAYKTSEPLALEGMPVTGQPKGESSGAFALPGRSSREETGSRPLIPWGKSTPPTARTARRGEFSKNVADELNLVAKWRPNSIAAEQFRVAATRLVLSARGEGAVVVVVTSAVNGEGKSTTSSNLAYVLAHDLGKRTIIIDCDFKRPMIHRYMGVPSKPGLAETICGDFPIETCTHSLGETQPEVIPCGRRDQWTLDLTKIPNIQAKINILREKFDFIIIDAPPILPLADMNLLGEMADTLVLVVRLGETPQNVVQAAVKSLKFSGSMGIILTNAEIGMASYLSQTSSPSAFLRESYSK